MEKIVAVTRTFQAGATMESFDTAKFEKGVIAPIRKLLRTAPENLQAVVVLTCGEYGSKYAEQVIDDETPSLYHLKLAFPEEVKSGLVIPQICFNWGLNAGSATALNQGLAVAQSLQVSRVLMWSPEIDLDGFMLNSMLSHAQRFDLPLVGYFRNRWYLRLQWTVGQNTCLLWKEELLRSLNGFNPDCNGDGVSKVNTPEFGEVPLAGMEDVEAYLRACKEQGSFLRWGMVGMNNPAYWNLALKEPGTDQYEQNRQKIARQGLVMEAYAQQIFPYMKPSQVYDEMMRMAHLQ